MNGKKQDLTPLSYVESETLTVEESPEWFTRNAV